MKKITGVMVYYHEICDKRLWYFSKGISMEKSSDLVSLGKIIDETSYLREKKQILIEDKINVDFLEDWKVIHEIKKSDKLEEASVWQVKYYIYVLREKGINIEKGIIDYPTLRKRKEVFFEEDDEIKLKDKLEEINKIIASKDPIKSGRKPYCRKCSYYDLCFL